MCQRASAQPRTVAKAGAQLAQGTICGGLVRAGPQPDAHRPTRTPTRRLGQWYVRNGRACRMRGQEVTQQAEPAPCCETSALITNVGGANRPRADTVAASDDQRRGCVADRKSLSLRVEPAGDDQRHWGDMRDRHYVRVPASSATARRRPLASGAPCVRPQPLRAMAFSFWI
jgi:hypothetical protein